MFRKYIHTKTKTAFGISLCFIICIIILLSDSARGQKTSQTGEQNRAPVILISGLGGSILSEKPQLQPCSGDSLKNLKHFKKEIVEDGFPKNVIIGDSANLEFDKDGNPRADTLSNKLKPVGFVNLPKPFKDICDLSLFLQSRRYLRDVTLFEFYYDFRYSVRHNAGELKIFIERIRNKFGYAKFDIIAHSLGGLIAKQYLADKAFAGIVRKLILVGTPNLGSPLALTAIRYGAEISYNFPFFRGCKVKRAFHNAPAFYNLLPGRKYFSLKGGYFIDSADIDGDGANGLLNFEQTVFNLKNGRETRCSQNNRKDSAVERLSEVLLDKEFENFIDARENWVKPQGVQVYVFAGYGIKTLRNIEERERKLKLSWSGEGDRIVPLWSAETIEADKIFYVNLKKLKTDHVSMIGKKEIKQNILSILQNGTLEIEKNFSLKRPTF